MYAGCKAEEQRDVLASAVKHVLRYGRVGKQSEARLKAALIERSEDRADRLRLLLRRVLDGEPLSAFVGASGKTFEDEIRETISVTRPQSEEEA